MMTLVDWWAVIALTIAATCLGLRGFMLKPSLQKWVTAPTMVWFWLLVLSIVLGMAVMSILAGRAHALGREAMVYSALALSSVVMLINLAQQTRDTDVLTQVFGHMGDDARLALRAALEKVRGLRS